MNTACFVVSTVLLITGCSFNGSTEATLRGSDIADRESYWANLETVTCRSQAVIPDGDARGITLGPIAIGNRSEVLRAVGLMADLSHPRAADTALRLCYDQDNDGQIDAEAEVEFFRASIAGWSGAVANACPQSLDGAYYFCAVDLGDDPLLVFRGLRAGGCFYLSVADTLPKDVGTLQQWSVRVECASATSDSDQSTVAKP
jgi:hypothetical protein